MNEGNEMDQDAMYEEMGVGDQQYLGVAYD